MTRMLRHILVLLTVCAQAAGCTILPELHLRQPMEAQIMLETQVNVSVMWQVDWQAQWQFPWSERSFGPVGYQEPSSIRVHEYPLDTEGHPMAHNVLNFHGTSTLMPIATGVYDLLFHNNDSETLLFNSEDELGSIFCTTRQISSGLKESAHIQTTSQKATRADSEPLTTEPVALMPDPLYVLYDRGQVISDKREDYELIDGRYVLHIHGELNPATYIYLFQVKLLNNEGRVVGSNGGGAITGVASGVDLQTFITSASTVSVPMDVYFDALNNTLGARVVTFGLPDINPYEEARSTKADGSTHYLVLNITYNNSTWKNIRIDISEELCSLPLGGVINLELDVNDFPPEGGTSGGGFDALIDEWEEESGSATIVN